MAESLEMRLMYLSLEVHVCLEIRRGRDVGREREAEGVYVKGGGI